MDVSLAEDACKKQEAVEAEVVFAKQRAERAQNCRKFMRIYFTIPSEIHSLYSTEGGNEHKGRIRTGVLKRFKHIPNISLQ